MMKMGWKALALAGIALLMLLALGLVRSLLDERQQRAEAVQHEIAQFSAGEQALGGPYLVLPYTVTVSKWQPADSGKGGRWVESQLNKQLLLSPAQLTVDGKLAVELLKRGLFEAPVYRSQLQLAGQFRIPALAGYEEKASSDSERRSTRWGTPYLALGVDDVRGIQQLQGQVGSQTLAFVPGARLAHNPRGVHAPLALAAAEPLLSQGQTLGFRLGLQLAGSSALLVEPTGDSTTVNLAGNWPHPSFSGNFAPQSRSVDAQGFRARWQTTELATGGNACLQAKSGCEPNRVGLRLLDPVDRYVLNERTMKYAELFVLLMMGGVFLLEVMHRVSVHPVQYTLLMLGLALFFLLTLSLSEHLGFHAAYWLAALASVVLLGSYGSSVLGSWRGGGVFAGMLAALYGLMFMILQSEDMALLMGSLSLFGLLALTMYFTRGIDWNSLGGRGKPDDTTPSAPALDVPAATAVAADAAADTPNTPPAA
ncbi:inner membrane protein [Vogesella perlucida]|nr:inner membrane protein [Vogesella perlucida]